GAGGVYFQELDWRRGVCGVKANAMIRAWLLAILQFGLGDGGAEVYVPERRRLELVSQPPLKQSQERQLGDALRTFADRGVRHRPVNRQAEISPQMLEDLFVFCRQALAQLDEVRPRDRDRLLRRFFRRNERRIVGQRRVAPDAEEVLH